MVNGADDQGIRPSPEEATNAGHDQTADDLGTGHDRGRQAGDTVGGRVAVQLEEVRLERVEREDADTRSERRREHQPAHRRIAQTAVDGAFEDRADLGANPDAAPRGESDVVHEQERDHQRHPEQTSADQVWHAEVGDLGDDTAQDGAGQHRDSGDDLRLGEDRLQRAAEAGRLERIDEPRLGRPREEREAEPKQDRGERPSEQPGADLPHHEVEQGREQESGRAQQERETATAGIGDHSGRDLEQHLADSEERVDREGLGVVEAGIEQEQGVDAPDERCRQGREQGQDEIGPLDRPRWVRHRPKRRLRSWTDPGL